MTWLLFMLLAQTSQADALFAGAVPQDVPTFRVSEKGGTPLYAGLKVDGAWVRESGTDFAPTQEIEVYPDTPWGAQEPYRTLGRRLEITYETGAMRRERLRKSWEDLGYVFRETPGGWRPILKDDADHADRARALVEAVRRQPAAAAESGAGTAPVAPQEAAPGGGRGRILAQGAFLLAVGGVLLWLVVKKLILGEKPWTPVQ
ncbi:MAG: hypothetical protein GXY15_15700 [Candidatus Hydrogenedentes bacterium]|nr:hypothetical protein [Candidatus Hydrogenedentota bacterium]